MCSTKSPSPLRRVSAIHGPARVRHEASEVMTSRVPSAWSTVMCAMNASGESGRPWPPVDQCVTNAKTFGAPARTALVTSVVS